MTTEVRQMPSTLALVGRTQVVDRDFRGAVMRALPCVQKVIQEQALDKWIHERIGVSPDNPDESPICRYETGITLARDAPSDVIDSLRAAIGDGSTADAQVTVVLRELPELKWFVYTHRGSYAGLANAWRQALAAFHEQGFKDAFTLAPPYESYMAHDAGVSEDDLRTEIRIPVAA